MAILRDSPLFLRNDVTNDTGAGIDIRDLQATQTGVNDDTTTAQFTNANDSVNRTWDPATAAVTNTNNAETTLFKTGYSFSIANMTPGDDTNCNAFLPEGTATINMQCTCTMTGTAPLTAGPQLTFKGSLWRYNPTTDTGVLIAGGAAGATVNWTSASVGNDLGTYKDCSFTIDVPAGGIEFAQGEFCLLQVGFFTNNVPNPLTGSSTYLCILRTMNTGTKITWDTGQSMLQVCTLSTNLVGDGVTARSFDAAIPRNIVGDGVLTAAKAGSISKTFDIVGDGAVTRAFNAAIPRSLVGDGVLSESRVVNAAKSFSLVGDGEVTRVLDAALSRSATGDGTVTATKATAATKTFSLVGDGVIVESRAVQAQRAFDLIGDGATSRVVAVGVPRDINGDGALAFTKAVTASKTFSLVGEGLVDRAIAGALSRDLLGEGVITEAHPVQAFRTFSLNGSGELLTTGPNASSITIPIDEIPTDGGGTTILAPVFVFDD